MLRFFCPGDRGLQMHGVRWELLFRLKCVFAGVVHAFLCDSFKIIGAWINERIVISGRAVLLTVWDVASNNRQLCGCVHVQKCCVYICISFQTDVFHRKRCHVGPSGLILVEWIATQAATVGVCLRHTQMNSSFKPTWGAVLRSVKFFMNFRNSM